MRPTLVGFCLIALAVALMVSAGEATDRLAIPGISGRDDRTAIQSAEYPWRAIGRVNNTLGPFCTGTLVGPRRVLTAAHCLWNPRTGSWLPACALHFVAGYQRGEYAAHSLVVSYQLAGSTNHNPEGPPTDPSQDWAILTLAEDLGETVRPLPTANFNKAQFARFHKAKATFLQAGYNRDYAHVLTVNRPCELGAFVQQERVVRHRCDATFGASGSPILIEIDGMYHVVAVLVGIESGGNGIAVTGAAFHENLQKIEPRMPYANDAKPC